MSAKSRYPLLEPEYKYPKSVCTDEEIMVAKSIREFADKEILPKRHDLEGGWHRDETLAHKTLYELYYKVHKLGLTTTILPEEYGGPGYSPVVRNMINEELSRGNIGLATLVGKVHWMVSFIYNRAAIRKDLMEEFVPKITGETPYVICVNITEPEGGANLEDPAFEFRTIRTIAKPEGDYWVINGSKIWPGPGGDYEYFEKWRRMWPQWVKGHIGYWTVVTSDPTKGREAAGMVYVPADAKGLTFSKPYQKLGFCWEDENVEVYYENVKVPRKYRVDTKPGDGYKILTAYVIGLGRLAGASRLTGLSTAALEIALEWTKDRQIAGVPVRNRSAFAMLIAEMFRAVDLSRMYYLTVTWMVMHPELYGDHWSPQMMARYSAARSFAGDTAMFVTNKAMELMGSYGYAYDYNIEKYYRDFKIVQMWLGGAQRDRLDIAQGLYGPFKWPGMETWLQKEKLVSQSVNPDPPIGFKKKTLEVENDVGKVVRKITGEREYHKEVKNRKNMLDYTAEQVYDDMFS
jgi:alkylation response protein AidB-like acyl-CoA dehydrogenase